MVRVLYGKPRIFEANPPSYHVDANPLETIWQLNKGNDFGQVSYSLSKLGWHFQHLDPCFASIRCYGIIPGWFYLQRLPDNGAFTEVSQNAFSSLEMWPMAVAAASISTMGVILYTCCFWHYTPVTFNSPSSLLDTSTLGRLVPISRPVKPSLADYISFLSIFKFRFRIIP